MTESKHDAQTASLVLDAPRARHEAVDIGMVDAAEEQVQWRSIRRNLWVGRSNDLPVGTIEKGHRYAVTDADGRTRGHYRRLEQAMRAFEPNEFESQRELDALAAPSFEGAVLAATLAGAAAVVLAIYGVLVLL